MKENGIPTDALESGKRKALIVDDDEELVELIRDALEADGRFEVRVANNGFDAGMMVKEYHPDVIVLDVMLPDINGKEVCQRSAAIRRSTTSKIICISGMVEQDKIAELQAAGANDFLQKPFEVEKLVDRMCQLLDVEPVDANESSAAESLRAAAANSGSPAASKPADRLRAAAGSESLRRAGLRAVSTITLDPDRTRSPGRVRRRGRARDQQPAGDDRRPRAAIAAPTKPIPTAGSRCSHASARRPIASAT